MRKLSFVMVVVLLLSTLTPAVFAAEPRAISVSPEITVDGTTATCNVTCCANYITDELEATIRLYRGNTLIATWTASGDGYIFFSETKTVLRGYTYTLKVDLKVNGVACPTASASDS